MVNLILSLLYRVWFVSAVVLLISILIFWYCGILASFLFFFLGVTGILYYGQDTVLYYPYDPPDSRVIVLKPSDINLPFESFKIQSRDGVKIHMYFIKQSINSDSRPTMIFFHGNAGNMGQRLTNISGFYHKLNVNILMVEYRGYGMSGGVPSEVGLYYDALAAFDFIMQRTDVDRTKILLFGRSLGGAVAIDLAMRLDYGSRVWAIVVENTFTSIPEMAKIILRWKCLNWLPMICHKNKYMSINKIPWVSTPILFICGSNDYVVPPEMSQELFMKCGATCKRISVIPGGGHDDTWTRRGYYTSIQQFISDVPPLSGNFGPFIDAVITKAPVKRDSVIQIV